MPPRMLYPGFVIKYVLQEYCCRENIIPAGLTFKEDQVVVS